MGNKLQLTAERSYHPNKLFLSHITSTDNENWSQKKNYLESDGVLFWKLSSA